MGAPMMPDHAKELARVVALWSRLEQMELWAKVGDGVKG